MSLSREAIFAANDLDREEVAIPQWGGSVWVKQMTVGQLLSFEESHANPDRKSALVWMAIHSVGDDQGKPLFTADDYDRLLEKSPAALLAIEPVASRLNSLTKEDKEQLEKK